ncbi:MAG: hypothetical protein Q7S31_00180 [bacterium]|nr:hypothetical protein [bacterium]
MPAFITPWVKSSLAAIGMLVFYFATLSILGGGWNFAWRQFIQYWYLITPIIITFAFQVYLSTKAAWVSGPTSAISMAACCAHHIADLIPLVGLVSIASFLTKYQVPALILALLVNLGSLAYNLHWWRQK